MTENLEKNIKQKINYIPLAEAGQILNTSRDYVNVLVRRGKLNAIKLGRNWFTTSIWLDEYQKLTGRVVSASLTSLKSDFKISPKSDFSVKDLEISEKLEFENLKSKLVLESTFAKAMADKKEVVERLKRIESKVENISMKSEEIRLQKAPEVGLHPKSEFGIKEISKKLGSFISSHEIKLPSRSLKSGERNEILERVKNNFKAIDSSHFQKVAKRSGILRSLKRFSNFRLAMASAAVAVLIAATIGLAFGLINFSPFGGSPVGRQFPRSGNLEASIFSDVFSGFPSDLPDFFGWLKDKSIAIFKTKSLYELAVGPLESGKPKIAKPQETLLSINTLVEAETLDLPFDLSAEALTKAEALAEEGKTPAELTFATSTPAFVVLNNRLSALENVLVDQIALVRAELLVQKQTILGLARLVPIHPISTVVVQGSPATLTSYSIAPQVQTGFDRLSASYLFLSNDAVINGILTVRSGASLNSLSVSGTGSFGGNLSAGGDFSLLGNAAISGALSVAGNTTLSNLTISGILTAASSSVIFANASTTNLTVLNNAWINQLSVTGTATSTFNNPIASFSGDFTIAGDSASNILLNPYGGNVGIGTTSPSSLLSVNSTGNVYFGGNLTVSGNTDLYSASTTNGTITNFWSTNGTITNASTTYLTVSDTAWLNNLNVSGATVLFNATTTSLAVTGSATTTFGGPISSASGNFIISGDSTSNILLNPYGGNVGIGTTTPSAKFSIQGDEYLYGNLTVTGTGGIGSNLTVTGQTFLSDGTAANPSLTFTSDIGLGLFKAGTDILGFTTNGSEKMRIDSSGNVGIGTTTTTYAQVNIGNNLAVLGTASSSFNGLVQFNGIPTGTDVDKSTIYINPSSSAAPANVLLGIAVNGSEKARINAEGDVQIMGIYTSSNVSATNQFSGNLSVLGDTILGTSTANIITLTGSIASSIIPNIDVDYNIGSPSLRFNNIYANNVIATTTTAGSTASTTFIINVLNPTNDLEDSSLQFSRGTAGTNATIKWDSNSKRFDFNAFPVNFQKNILVADTSSSTFSGPVWFTGTSIGTATSSAVVFINSPTYNPGDNIFDITVAGEERFRVNAEGNTYIRAGLNVANAITPLSADNTITIAGNIQINGNTIKDSLGATRLTIGASNEFTGNLNIASGNLTVNNGSFEVTSAGAASSTSLFVLNHASFGTASTTYGTITNLFSTNGTITNASTTNLTVSGNLWTGASSFLNIGGTLLLADGTVSNPSLAFTNSPNTGIYRSAADQMSFTTASTNALTIKNNQYVGIGNTVTDPQTQLEVGIRDTDYNVITDVVRLDHYTNPITNPITNGFGTGILFYGQTSLGAGQIMGRIASQVEQATSTDPGGFLANLSFWTWGSGGLLEKMRLTANGQLALATTTMPSGYGVNIATSTFIYGSLQVGTSSLKLMSGNIISDSGQFNITNAANTAMAFSTNNAEAMRIDNSGKVGIGSTTPSAVLSVNVSNAAGNTPALNINSATSSLLFVRSDGNVGINTTNPTQRFQVNDSATAAFVVTSAGQVGIGTTTPYYKLDVFSDTQSVARVKAGQDAGFYMERGLGSSFSQLQFTTTGIGSDSWAMGLANDSSDFSIIGGSTRLLIERSTGNVGIGTTAPGDSVPAGSAFSGKVLDIDGGTSDSAVFIRSGTDVGANIWSDYSSADVYIDSIKSNASTGIGRIRFRTRTDQVTPVDAMLIEQNGNVGIGTTGPGKILETSSLVANAQLRVRSTDYVQYTDWGVDSAATNFGAGIWLNGTQQAHIYGGGMSLGSYINTDPPAGGIITSGNVGIGTTGPRVKLEVSGTASTPSATEKGIFNVYASTGISLAMGGYLASPYGAWIQALDPRQGNADTFPLLLNPVGGYVGIGTTGPGNKLHVVTGTVYSTTGNDTAKLEVNGMNGIGLVSSLGFQTTQTNLQSARLGVIGSNFEENWGGGLVFYTKPANGTPNDTVAEAMRINSLGNVGIGTTNPDQGKVEVKGGTVCVDTNSDDNATQCIASESDIRLKENIAQLSGALDKLLQLRGVSFDWKVNDPEVLSHWPLISRFASRPHSVGLVAQEVQPILPEAVSLETVGDKEVQYLQLDYERFTPLIIEAIKEMNVKIDAIATSTLQAKQGTIDLATVNSDINLNGFSILNIKSIAGINGLWKIDESGNLVVQSVNTQALTVGGGNASGVTVYDRGTTQPKCVYVENDVIKISAGACGATQNSGTPAVIETASAAVAPMVATSTTEILPTATSTTEITIPALEPIATTTEPVIVSEMVTTTTATSTP